MITVPPIYTVTQIATVPDARELALSPSGDLYVGTGGQDVYIVRRAEGAHPESARVYVTITDAPDSGVAYGNGSLYVGTQHGVWRVQNGKPAKLASVRTGSPPAGSDGDVHYTTSVAVNGPTVYASVGSSCNACVETDPTRATVGKIEHGRYMPIATRIRNAIALAVDPVTHHLWAGNAGQDELAAGHPYEFFDDVSVRRAPVDYGWPFCYDDRKQKPGTHDNCADAVIPQAVFPAYETPIGAVFAHGGAFVTLHGSWHGPAQGLAGYVPPRVVFIPMKNGKPLHAVKWNDPAAQWVQFIGGYQTGGTVTRSGRPTGITAAPNGDLFLADGQTGAIYRITPKRSH
jgi:glucose/arabinose dehydrogenase